MLEQGAIAPDFTLTDQDGKEVSLSAFKGKRVVLYFYPRDNTPGCTTEACGFRDVYDYILAKGAVVLGVSPDSRSSHAGFRDRYSLPFHLLSDADHAVAALYGAWGKKKNYGREYEGIIRSTFIISPEGRVEKLFPKVTPAGHAEEVLDALG
jgi:thioredoxin-dependent peroxiredoxin